MLGARQGPSPVTPLALGRTPGLRQRAAADCGSGRDRVMKVGARTVRLHFHPPAHARAVRNHLEVSMKHIPSLAKVLVAAVLGMSFALAALAGENATGPPPEEEEERSEPA